MWAAGVLETSPLGTPHRLSMFNGWSFIAEFVAVEAVLLFITGIFLLVFGRTWSAPDIGRIAIVGAIVAFIVHLLAVARRDASFAHSGSQVDG